MQDVCLFAHFDKDDKVDEYVLRYLQKVRELDFSTIFISTARLSRAAVERLRTDCDDVILRGNAGLDFASWAAGFAKYGGAIGGRLLLANDSVYGPFGNLAAALAQMTRRPADFYGMVESPEAVPHLQSWFMLFEPQVVRSREFSAVLAQPFVKMTRREIIDNGEIGLSRRLAAAGFRYEALYRGEREKLMPRRHDANPMLLFWRELLFECGVPFLKIELLRDNAIGVEDAAAILQAVEPVDPELCALVRAHLARTTKGVMFRRPPRLALSRARYALIRNRYRLRREQRRVAASFNLMQIEALTALLNSGRAFRRLLSPRRWR